MCERARECGCGVRGIEHNFRHLKKLYVYICVGLLGLGGWVEGGGGGRAQRAIEMTNVFLLLFCK